MSLVYIISAPSGSGKSTLVRKLLESVPGLNFSISYTTRPPRGDEHNGVEYFFISRREFDKMITQDQFLEYANVFGDAHSIGDCYGTARRFLMEAEDIGNDLVLDIDVQGAEQVKKKIPDAVTIFILPPNREELEKRLRSRGLDKEEVILRRLDTARREIENYSKYDYILVNDQLDQSADQLKAIVLAERLCREGKEISRGDSLLLERAQACRLEQAREHVQPILASFAPQAAGGR